MVVSSQFELYMFLVSSTVSHMLAICLNYLGADLLVLLTKNVFDFVVNLHAVSKKAKSSVAKNPKQINTSYDVCAFCILLQGFERSVENLWDRRSCLVYGIVRLGPE